MTKDSVNQDIAIRYSPFAIGSERWKINPTGTLILCQPHCILPEIAKYRERRIANRDQ
jgi:hypothetical protein